MTSGERVEVRIEDLALGGAGVARHQGFVLLVARAVPGDHARARVVSTRPAYALAEIEELLAPSPDRVEPHCRHFEICGGCAYQNLAIARQTEAKARQVREVLRRIGHLDEPTVLEPIAAPSPYGYRNRIELTACLDAAGRTRLGFHRRDGSGEIFPVEECPIAAPPLEALRAAAGVAVAQARLAPFDTRTRCGFLRRVVLRSSARGETLVELRTSRPDPRPLRGVVESLAGHPGLRGIVQAVDRGGRRSMTSPPRLLWGKPALEDEILGLRLEVPAGAFSQTHAAMTESLYQEGMRALGEVAGRACLDLFCGVGALSLLAARAGAREVMGVEVDAGAAEAAARNARRAGAAACRFAHADVDTVLAGAPAPIGGGRFERAIVNPPRSGLSPAALGALARLGPERLAYLSCDPATLARDLRALTASGYRVEWVRPLDLFPQTAHVETATCLVRP